MYLLWTSPLKDEKQCFPRRGYQQMQRKKAHRTLPRFPRLIPTVFPAVVMIERCRPLCSLKSLTKNPAWAVNAASSFQLSTRRNCQIFGWNSTNISQYAYFGLLIHTIVSLLEKKRKNSLQSQTRRNHWKAHPAQPCCIWLRTVIMNGVVCTLAKERCPRASDVPVTCAPCEIGVSMLI